MSRWYETPLGQARLNERQVSAQNSQETAKKRTNRAAVGGISRMYAAARSSRLTEGWSISNSSADAELVSSLTTLRSRSRALVRDCSYAKRAKMIVINNVIGTGIGMQAQVLTTRGTPANRVNEEIEALWKVCSEARNFHTGGRLSSSDMERALVGQVFEAGDVLIREYPEAFGNSPVPYAVEMIEAERMADQYSVPMIGSPTGNEIRMGVEVNRFLAHVAYWTRERHQNEIRFGGSADRLERIPATDAKLLALVDRWPQTRGEPWLHATARRLNDMDGYSEAEIIRARAQAVRMGIIQTPEGAESMADELEDGSFEMELEPGIVTRLNPGEEWHDSAPSAPNPQLDPFMRYMLREVAAGLGVSYESLSKDYSQSNYSASRLSLLDERDGWRALQGWFIREFRAPMHRAWLRQAVLSRVIKSISVEEYAIDPLRFEAVRFRPRGWGWVDPTKEVNAFKDAVRSGFMTLQDVISTSGADFEEMLTQRKKEVELAEAAGLVFDTDPKQVSNAGLTQARPVGTTLPLEQEEAVKLAADKRPPEDDDPPPDDGGNDADTDDPPTRRVFNFRRTAK